MPTETHDALRPLVGRPPPCRRRRHPRRPRAALLPPTAPWPQSLRATHRAPGSPPASLTHALRSYYATTLATEGVAVHRIAGRLGHASIQTTSRYLAETDRDVASVSEILDRRHRGAAPPLAQGLESSVTRPTALVRPSPAQSRRASAGNQGKRGRGRSRRRRPSRGTRGRAQNRFTNHTAGPAPPGSAAPRPPGRRAHAVPATSHGLPAAAETRPATRRIGSPKAPVSRRRGGGGIGVRSR